MGASVSHLDSRFTINCLSCAHTGFCIVKFFRDGLFFGFSAATLKVSWCRGLTLVKHQAPTKATHLPSLAAAGQRREKK